jgi:hypothetical protein
MWFSFRETVEVNLPPGDQTKLFDRIRGVYRRRDELYV